MKLRPLDLSFLAWELKRHMNQLDREMLNRARQDKAFQAFLKYVQRPLPARDAKSNG